MKISTITFTGADDRTDQSVMQAISDEFPRVEWGILFSRGNRGMSRYPKLSWLAELIKTHPGIHLSAHLCGQYVRDLLAGDFGQFDMDWSSSFKRIQVNFHGIKVDDTQAEAFLGGLASYDQTHEWILQMDGVNENIYWAAKAQAIRVFPLFDLSGGDGVTPDTWPTPTADFCGYAGGLGPHNLEEQLKKIEGIVDSDDPIWIDFETWVRNDKDEFCFDRIRQCLEIARPYMS